MASVCWELQLAGNRLLGQVIIAIGLDDFPGEW